MATARMIKCTVLSVSQNGIVAEGSKIGVVEFAQPVYVSGKIQMGVFSMR